MDPDKTDPSPDQPPGLGVSRTWLTVALAIFAAVHVLDGGLALILLVVFAAMGWRYFSQIPVSQRGTMTDTAQDLCAGALACAAGGAVWVGAFSFGIAIDVTPFLYPVGDEVYPYSGVYNIASGVVGVLGAVLMWRLLTKRTNRWSDSRGPRPRV